MINWFCVNVNVININLKYSPCHPVYNLVSLSLFFKYTQ